MSRKYLKIYVADQYVRSTGSDRRDRDRILKNFGIVDYPNSGVNLAESVFREIPYSKWKELWDKAIAKDDQCKQIYVFVAVRFARRRKHEDYLPPDYSQNFVPLRSYIPPVRFWLHANEDGSLYLTTSEIMSEDEMVEELFEVTSKVDDPEELYRHAGVYDDLEHAMLLMSLWGCWDIGEKIIPIYKNANVKEKQLIAGIFKIITNIDFKDFLWDAVRKIRYLEELKAHGKDMMRRNRNERERKTSTIIGD